MSTGKQAAGGVARSNKLDPARRKEIAVNAVKAREAKKLLPVATHGSSDHPLRIGGAELPCYVLKDGRRVLTMRGLQQSLGFSTGGGKDGARKVPAFLTKLEEKGLEINDLSVRANSPFDFILPESGKVATAYEATLLVDICEAILDARSKGILAADSIYAIQCEALVRGLARVGIVALVDEATGYQKERAKDALVKILEAWVAKELQPYVKTFPAEFYEELFRLRGLGYPPEKQHYRPQYFGLLTNDIVYERLAPGLLEEMKRQAQKDEKRSHLHRRLTTEVVYPRLKEHLASVTTIMKLSDDYQDFIKKLNRIHARFGDTYTLDLDDTDR